MKYKFNIVSILYIILGCATIGNSQIIRFFPEADTVYIGGGCTPPEIYCSVTNIRSIIDSINIDKKFNTNIWTEDSSGNHTNYDYLYFLVKDSLNQYDYELWIDHKYPNSGSSILIPFDSTYYFDAAIFNLKLFVKMGSIIQDSLCQPFIAKIGVNVKEKKQIILSNLNLELYQNYPNPFNSETIITYHIPKSQYVILKIFDVKGKEIETLVNEELESGNYKTKFIATELPSGIYFYQIISGKFSRINKLLLIK